MRFLLTFCAFVSLTSLVQADDKLTVKDLIGKSMDAMGGEKLIKKYPGSIQKSKGTIVIMGVEMPFTTYELHLMPDKSKSLINLDANGQEIKIVQIVNGDKFHMTLAGQEMDLDDNAKLELTESQMLARVMNLYPLLEEKGFETKLSEEKTKIDGKETYVLTVKHEKLSESKLFFDAKSFLVVRVEREGANGSGQRGKQEWTISDYKKQDGLFVPMKTKVLHDGKAFLEAEVTEMKLVEKIDKSEFDVSK